MGGRAVAWALAGLVLTAWPPDRLTGQEPQRPDTLRPNAATDTAAIRDSIIRRRNVVAESLRIIADSLNPDSLRFTLPLLGPPPGPLPQGRRYVFSYDELRWSGALTLGELLNRVPGVMMVRIASVGQGEIVTYAGQGPAAVEIYQDGFQIDPLGADRNGYDVGRFDIGQLQRVEVEVLPTVLRVHLITDTQAARRARTEASFSTGDASTNAYRLRYLNRWSNGAGISVGASFLGTQGPLTSRGKVGLFQILVKGMWMPTDRTGVEFQVNTYKLEREQLVPIRGGAPDFIGVDVSRTDMFLRAYAASRADGRGLRLDAIIGSTGVSDTSGLLDANAGQASLTLGWRSAHLSAETWARLRDTSNPFDVGGRLAWSPISLLTVTGAARQRTLLGSGALSELDVAGEIRPLRWLSFHGDVRRRVLDSTVTPSDTIERVTDWTAGAMISTRRLMLDASLGRTGPFTAPAFGIYQDQLPGTVTTGTDVFQGSWQVNPWRWFTLSGWLRMPASDSVPFDPPTHSLTRATLRSQFLPHFRRNAFDAEFQLEMEAWGEGVAGVDTSGAAVRLVGQTVFNLHVQFRLVGALLYWTLRNVMRTQYGLLPGYDVPRSFQRFGIRWEFTN